MVICIGFLVGLLSNLLSIFIIFMLSQILFIKRISLLSLLIAFSLLSGYLFNSNSENNISNDLKDNNNFYLNSLESKVVELENTGSFSNTYIVETKNSSLLSLIKIPIDSNYLPGQKLKISGVMEKFDSGAFDTNYIQYLNSKKVYYSIDTSFIQKLDNNSLTLVLSRIKQQFEGFIGNKLPGEPTSLMTGILFGSKDNIDNETKEALNRSGTSHIISASGFNVMIIFLFVSQSGKWVRKDFVRLVAIPLMFLYVVFIGWSIYPARRALYMIVILLFANNFGRKIPIFNILIISVILILLEFPGYINNISLQLSALATLGLIVFYEKLNYLFVSKFKFKKEISSIISGTLSATLATMPITILTFGSLSFISVITNVFVLPFIPILMLLGFLLILSSLVNLTILIIFIAILTRTLSGFVLSTIEFFAKLDFASSADLKLIVIFCSICISVLVLSDYFFVNNEKLKNNTSTNRDVSNIS